MRHALTWQRGGKFDIPWITSPCISCAHWPKSHLKRDQKQSFEHCTVVIRIQHNASIIFAQQARLQPKFSSFPGLQGCNPAGPCTYTHCPLPKEIDERDKSAPFVIYSVTIKTKTLKQHNILSWMITITDFTGYRDQTTLLARLSYSRVDRILHPLHPSPHPPAMAAQSPHVVAFLDCFSQRVTSAPGPCARAVTCTCAYEIWAEKRL